MNNRVVVCGTGFGRIYLAGVTAPGSPYELAGILARGSARSAACAARYRVPLFRDPDALPDDVDLACVVVGSAITGGPGARLAAELMARGVHVLQEHPLHAAELTGCLRAARRHGVQYRVNTHHVHVSPVRGFVRAARALLRSQPPVFVDVATSFQVLYTTFDILASVLGRLRPWRFAPPAEPVTPGPPFRALEGTLAGVPVTLRVQHQMDPEQPDNHAHMWHRITLGVEGGNLTLVSSNGPVVWCPRPHLPRGAADLAGFDELTDGHIGEPAAEVIGPRRPPTWREVLTEQWPAAVLAALTELRDAAVRGADPLPAGQYHLALCELTQRVSDLLGPVELVTRPAPRILSAADFATE